MQNLPVHAKDWLKAMFHLLTRSRIAFYLLSSEIMRANHLTQSIKAIYLIEIFSIALCVEKVERVCVRWSLRRNSHCKFPIGGTPANNQTHPCTCAHVCVGCEWMRKQTTCIILSLIACIRLLISTVFLWKQACGDIVDYKRELHSGKFISVKNIFWTDIGLNAL